MPSDFEWYHLLQLSKSDPHPYSHANTPEREMRTRERMQIIRFMNQAINWNRLPSAGQFLLREHVEINDFGRRFMEWRRRFPPYNEVW